MKQSKGGLLMGNLRTQNVYAEFKELEGEKQLWPFLLSPKEQELEMHYLERSRKIQIELKELKPDVHRTGRVYFDESRKFLCDDSGLGILSQGPLQIYKGGSSRVTSDLFGSFDRIRLRVTITLNRWGFSGVGKQAECSQKEITKVKQQTLKHKAKTNF